MPGISRNNYTRNMALLFMRTLGAVSIEDVNAYIHSISSMASQPAPEAHQGLNKVLCDSAWGTHGYPTQSKSYDYRTEMQHYAGIASSQSQLLAGDKMTEASDYVQHCLRKLDVPSASVNQSGLVIIVSVSPDLLAGWRWCLEHFGICEWILHLDGDSIFVDFHKDLGKFTSSSQHMFFQIRLNKQVTAAAALLRTSPFTECFLRLWAGKGINTRANWDNGDLLTTLLDFSAPDLALECGLLRDSSYDGAFIPCFSKARSRLLALHHSMPIGIIPPLAGFQKSLEGLHDEKVKRDDPDFFKLAYCCWTSDIIGHGSKAIGTWAWSGREDRTKLFPVCLYNSAEEELDIAQRCCLWYYPGSIFGGTNVCQDASHCISTTGTIRLCSKYSK